jgi:hypothetical protein
MTDKKFKVEFAAGAFDHFDGTQEELDALQKEILDVFSNLTSEELAEMSHPLDLDSMSDEEIEALTNQLTGERPTLQ